MNSLTVLFLSSTLVSVVYTCCVTIEPPTTAAPDTTAAATEATTAAAGRRRRRSAGGCSCDPSGSSSEVELFKDGAISCTGSLLSDSTIVTSTGSCSSGNGLSAEVYYNGIPNYFAIASSAQNGGYVMLQLAESITFPSDNQPLCFESGLGGTWGMLPAAGSEMDWISGQIQGQTCN